MVNLPCAGGGGAMSVLINCVLGCLAVALSTKGAWAQASLYFIHPDHLDTPRLIADSNGGTVWRNDNSEPFGDSVPDQNPSGLGAFEFPMMLSRYYRDKETGNEYAMYRDAYDPGIGRFPQSDPSGLNGGLNTYAYVEGNPVSLVDPSGLKVLIIGHIAAGIGGLMTFPASYHVALYLDPDDKCECKGNWPLTIGGQPSGGKLVLKYNYAGDSIGEAKVQQLVPTPSGMTDCEFIKRIMRAAASYGNTAKYSLPTIIPVPGIRDGQMSAGEYNSNSLVSGILSASGGTPPTVQLPTRPSGQLPGYQNPVPIQ